MRRIITQYIEQAYGGRLFDIDSLCVPTFAHHLLKVIEGNQSRKVHTSLLCIIFT